MTWSWGSMLSKQSCLNTHLLICAIPKSCTLPSAWPVLDAWIAWSFEALAKGWRPCEDPWGKGSWHPLLASPRLKGTTALWSIQGDAEFYSNVLKVGHWASQYPCCMPFWQVSQDIESIRARLQICVPSRGTPCQKEQSCTLWNPWCFNSYDQG